jgi:hypothetical protein
MAPVNKEKRIKSKEEKARYQITNLARLERIEAHRRGLRNQCALLECILADSAKDKACQYKVNAEYKKKIEMQEQEIKVLRQKITGIKKSLPFSKN